MASYDLNGAWEGYFATPALPTVIQIHHDGYHISADLLRDDLTPTGQTFFRGEIDPKTFTADIQVAGYSAFSALTNSQSSSWSPGALNILDPDHVQIGNRPAFQRITMPGSNDVPCESGNHFKIQAEWAGMRGKRAQNAKDYKTAVCWFYVAAIQGDAKAQWYVAYYLYDGKGVPKDSAQAFQWALKSAENGSDYGAFTVALMYELGDGTVANSPKAKYWHARGNELQIEKQKKAAADKAQERQQREGMLELGAMGVIGAAIIAGELKQSSDCDQDTMRYTDEEIRDKRKRVEQSGQRCENGELVPSDQ
jgi:hypothetical protein